ncbi:Uncharacterised protein [Legionella steigerwaltii]|uniref:Uncharacterized protein n=1 Tax=Legionella steigerwaltii TaxID=460 RepID=A0A378L764_9GAMM|nr:hypothetical protein [Legionella steigerwaltii]KTD80613.1 hypothetical protein Lstg_0449 [Legionella steigerwaltii]STY22547.1 Uncharacterised protein [Legionella steigerwaltii]
MKVKAYEWMSENGELNLASKSQKELAQNPKSQEVLSQYRFFKENGFAIDAQKIRKNVNHAMEIAYERDAGFGPSEHLDHANNTLGF